MSSNLNSPKMPTFPVVHGSKFSPSAEKSSQTHRSTFHLSNLFHSLTKFSRNIRTTNAFVRSTSTHADGSSVKLTRRSFSKKDASPMPSIHRPSSCFILLSPSRHEQDKCLFFQKPTTAISPKPSCISSFSKIKRVSSFLLPLKRKQSLALNHSLHERSFKAKESSKRRSRLLNHSLIKHKHSTSISLPSDSNGTFGYRSSRSEQRYHDQIHVYIDLIRIDLILQIRLNACLPPTYRPLVSHTPAWPWVELQSLFYGILVEQQALVFLQPKLFSRDSPESQGEPDFIHLPFRSMVWEENASIALGYDPLAPSTVRIAFKWIAANSTGNFCISSQVCCVRSA